MAALQARLNIPSTALAAATAKSVGQLKAPANQRLKLLGYGVFFDGTSNTAQPVQLRLTRATAAFGTFTSTPPLPKEEGLPETIQATGGTNATVEPTVTQVLGTETVHPQLGWCFLAPPGQEITVKGGSSINIELTSPAIVNARGWMDYEE